MKTHRVGTITFGSMLILFGSLFLVHMFVPALSYCVIFHLWPCVFILLGIEVLLSNFKLKNVAFTYDKTSIFLMLLLAFFAIAMAFVETEMYWRMEADIRPFCF